uniref:Uncharacterized protein n=1 Tax=Anguilla anguilla TaxID=7936 RepID=A0A0E9XTR7_ANGAN
MHPGQPWAHAQRLHTALQLRSFPEKWVKIEQPFKSACHSWSKG